MDVVVPIVAVEDVAYLFRCDWHGGCLVYKLGRSDLVIDVETLHLRSDT